MGREPGMKQTNIAYPAVKHFDVFAEKADKRKTRSSVAAEAQTQQALSGRKRAPQPTPATVVLQPAKEQRTTRSTKQPGKKARAPSSPVKASRRHKASAGTNQESGAVFFERYTVNGQEYRVGQDIYVTMTEDWSALPDDDVEEVCSICTKVGQVHTLIECDRCLGGYHMSCLKPRLKQVPEGSWLCPSCARGEAPAASRPLRMAYEKYLFASRDKPVLTLGRIMAFVKNRQGSDGQVEVVIRYYLKPEETYLGRQAHHGAREVFQTAAEHYESVQCIFDKAHVCKPQDYDSTSGPDVFLCEYEYDELWKRFRRCSLKATTTLAPSQRTKKGARVCAVDTDSEDDSDEEFNAAAEQLSSDDEDRDRSFKPIYAFWAERGMLAGAGTKAAFKGRRQAVRGAGGALNRHVGAQEVEDGVELVGGGTSALPSRAPLPPLAAARRALSLATVPGSLPCRDTEKAHMHRFVSEAVGDEGQGTGPGVMYVCGVPGTGKTACINEVIAANKASAQAAGVQLISLNALSLPTPGHVYSKLWEKVAGQRAGPARALAALEAHFSAGATAQGRGRCMTLLVVDEIDVLITKDQSVLYNLFEWPMRPGARLAVIGISNTHDLDERVLPRISSRLANAKLAFNPYSVDQLRQIIGQRVAAAGCGLLFKEAAIQWVARKVAATTGDVRRALELLRRAVEVAEAARCKANAPPLTAASSPAELKGFITEGHVKVAVNEMFGTPHMLFLRACSQLEKTALVGLLLEMRATNRPQVSVQALHHRLVSHLSLLVPDAAAVQPGTLNRALAVLAAKRLLLASPSWQGIRGQVTLAVHKDDVCSAIKEDTQLVALHTQLS